MRTEEDILVKSGNIELITIYRDKNRNTGCYRKSIERI